MRRIALTGGIACGKSLVAKYLNELGVATVDADDIVHELLPDPAERKRIAAEVFADPEKRKALEARLHPVVRDAINNRITEWANNRMSRDDGGESKHSVIRPFGYSVVDHSVIRPFGYSVIDHSVIQSFGYSVISPIAIIPLLFETRWDSDYDIICAVISPRETQVERMMTTRGYTREEAEARLGAQMPVTEKAAKSHYVINNDGTPEELRKEVERLVSWLVAQCRA